MRQKLRNDIEPFVLAYCANGSVTPAHIAQILQLYTENFGNNMVMKLGISCCDVCFLLHLCILLGKKIKIQKEIVTLRAASLTFTWSGPNYDIDLQDFLLFKWKATTYRFS